MYLLDTRVSTVFGRPKITKFMVLEISLCKTRILNDALSDYKFCVICQLCNFTSQQLLACFFFLASADAMLLFFNFDYII
jgi:hypothetical protein